MNITGFEIENFKGIRKAKIEFSDNDVARIHTLVGLNESGKTTLLEAMHSFAPDSEVESVVDDTRSTKDQTEKWVPKGQIANFTGEVSVLAHVECLDDEWQEICESLESEHGIDIDQETLKNKFTIRRAYKYENGDYSKRVMYVGLLDSVRARERQQRKFRPLSNENRKIFWREVFRRIPTVAYYPTFFFDFPEKIYLTSAPRGKKTTNKFYRQLFTDILDYEGSGYTIEGSILNRVRNSDFHLSWTDWNSLFRGSPSEDKVKQVIARAERAVTKVVFSKWNEVFGEEVGNKEISIYLDYDKGKASTDGDGNKTDAVEHDVYIRFQIKDGANIYHVDERSLGFRWFFSFLMFTQFRIHRKEKKPTIFLFDEPASNLHAAAQQKLLESFPAIAKSPHRLVYSTHSHYMVNPLWLDQAYIVYDAANADTSEILEQGFRPDASVDVKAVPYRKFVRKHPQKINYFQPVLDTLEVRPSKFDLNVGGLIVEGKSDYYLLKASEVVAGNELGVVFPAQGSGTMGALVALHRGWGLPVRVLLDGDQGGEDGRRNLLDKFQLQDSEITYLSEMVSEIKTIEDIFSDEYRQKLIDEGSDDPKRALLRIVQECVAAGDLSPLALDKATKDRMTKLIDALRKFVDSGNKGKS